MKSFKNFALKNINNNIVIEVVSKSISSNIDGELMSWIGLNFVSLQTMNSKEILFTVRDAEEDIVNNVDDIVRDIKRVINIYIENC